MSKRLTRFIDGERYRLAVFRVKSEFPNGTPRLVERVPEHGTQRLSENVEENRFFTAYVLEDLVTPKEQ